MSHGGEAAELAVSVFTARLLRTPRLPPHERLQHAAKAANEAVYRAFSGRSGSTLSAVIVHHDGRVLGINAGDSRIYGVTASKDFVQLTRDDTLAEYLGQDARANIHQNRLVQFIGMGEG